LGGPAEVKKAMLVEKDEIGVKKFLASTVRDDHFGGQANPEISILVEFCELRNFFLVSTT
jgi:hypothetical protein